MVHGITISLRQNRISQLLLSLLVALSCAVCTVSIAHASGPLRSDQNSPRYFFDTTGKAVFLSGAHVNYRIVDNFPDYFDFLKQHNHNFARLWSWEQAIWGSQKPADLPASAIPYRRSGLKYDLSRFNNAYFDELRSRISEAAQRGIYVSVPLFEGQRRTESWVNHPYYRDNNINGIDADPRRNWDRRVIALQEAYLRKVVDTLNDLDNVLYEISGEAPAMDLDWQLRMVNYLKSYQSGKPNQHPVGMSYTYNPEEQRHVLLEGPADWLLIESGETPFPPPAAASKVLFWKADPKRLGGSASQEWVWRSFTRGFNVVYEETNNNETTTIAREAVRKATNYAQFLSLSKLSPNTNLCSTEHCLLDPGVEYFIYLPSGNATVDLSGVSQNFKVSWLDTQSGQISAGGTVSGGGEHQFKAPGEGGSLLHLALSSSQGSVSSTGSKNVSSTVSQGTSITTNSKPIITASPITTVAAPTISPNGGAYTNAVPVTLQTSTTGSSIYYTIDGTSPTEASTKYSGPFSLTASTLVKAKAFKNGSNPSAESSAWFSHDNISVSGGSSGLVAHWKFDEGSGESTSDASGNGNTASLKNGPRWVSGKVGKALVFDGVDDNLTVVASNSLGISTAFTIAAWVNASSINREFASIVYYPNYYLYASSTTAYCATGGALGGFYGGIHKTVCEPSPLLTNTWSHLAVSYDGSALTLYRNGLAVGSFNASGSLSPTSGTLQIGGSEFGEYFKGVIDEVRIYSKSLTAAEIEGIYQQDGGTPQVVVSPVTPPTPVTPQTVAKPAISPSGGNYSGSVLVTIETATPVASVHYTTNGSTPTESSNLYTGPLTLTSSMQLKAKAFKSGFNPSSVASASFTKNDPPINSSSPGLVAHWKFDEGNGHTAADASGGGNAATLVNGPLWVTGKAGKGLLFDGIDDNLAMADSSSLDLSSSAFTVAAWVNPSSISTEFAAIVYYPNYYLYASSTTAYCPTGSALGGLYGETHKTVCEPSPLPTNTWSHLAVTYNGSALTLYRNGVAVGSFNASGSLSPTSGTLQIGGSEFGEYFKGVIDEVRIYNIVLSAADIQDIYVQEGGVPQNVAAPVVPPTNGTGQTIVTPVTPPQTETLPPAMNFTLSTGGNKSVNAGSSVSNSVSANLTSGSGLPINFSVSGLPEGVTAFFSSGSCSPACSTLLNISVTEEAAAGNFPITVTGAGGGVSRTTAFTLSVLLAAAAPSSGATPENILYVGKNGSDANSCSQARNPNTPKFSIRAALSCIGTSPGGGAGQTVEVSAGTYAETIRDLLPSGASWNAPFTLRAKRGDPVILQSRPDQSVIYITTGGTNGAMYSVVDGFIIDGINLNQGPAIVTISAVSDVRLQNNEIKNANVVGAPGSGVANSHIYASTTATRIQIINNIIHDGSSAGHGIYNEGSNNIIDGNKLYNIGGFGIHVYNAINGNSNGNTIRNNTVYNFGLQRVTAAGIGIAGGVGNRVYNNSVHSGIGKNRDGGIGIGLGGSRGSQVYNNTVHNNTWIGLDGRNSTNATITDNIAYGNNPNLDMTGAVGGAVSNNNYNN